MPEITLAILCVLAVGALLWAEYKDLKRLRWLAKPAASLAFVLLALAAGGLDSAYGRAVTAGLALCMLGDILLIPKSEKTFLAGMGAFAAGHAAYIAAFLTIGGPPGMLIGIAAAVLVVTFGGVVRWLWPHLGSFRLPVAGYCLIIGAMAIASFMTISPAGGGPYWIAAAGAAGFAVSDIAVARDQFVQPGFINRLWGLPLYYGAQLLLASSVSL